MQHNDFAPVQHNDDDDPFADPREAQDAAAQRPANTRKRFGSGVTSAFSRLLRSRDRGEQPAVTAETIDDPFGGPLDTYSDPNATEELSADEAKQALLDYIEGIKGEYTTNGTLSKASLIDHTLRDYADDLPSAVRSMLAHQELFRLPRIEVIRLGDRLTAYEKATSK